MTKACNLPFVATYNNRWLVVMGGNGKYDGIHLSRVEILDTTEPLQWYQAASLPQPCYQVPSATIGNMCYLLGGFSKEGVSKKVFSVCLDDLISQATSQTVSPSAPPIPVPSPWQSLPDTCTNVWIHCLSLQWSSASNWWWLSRKLSYPHVSA